MSATLLLFVGQYAHNSFDQYRDFMLDCIPQDILVYAEVLVSNHIAQSSNLAPFHLWVTAADFWWYVLDRFANDRQVTYHGIESLLVLYKLAEGQTPYVAHDLLASLAYVIKIEAIIT